MAETFDGSQNLVCGLGPFEGLRVSVVQVDEGTDVGFEPLDGGVDTSLDLLSGEFSEPALDRFAHLKTHHGFERMRLRGLFGARNEFHLAAIVQNLKTIALRLLGPPTGQMRASIA